VHAQRHVEEMTQLVLTCDNLLQLQAALSIHLHQFTPSCIATAMRHLQHLRQQELQQQATNGGAAAPVMQAVQLQLAGQLTEAMLRQVPLVSAGCLASFLAAAAAMRLVMPGPVLEEFASHLVNKALWVACQQHSSVQTHAGPHQQQLDRHVQAHPHSRQQQLQDQQQVPPASSRSDDHQRQPVPHAAALSAWALAKLRLRSEPLWRELCSIAGEQLHHMSASDCVLLAWACAKTGHSQQRLFYALQQHLRPQAPHLSPDNISSLLWSYAAAGQYHPAWLSALVDAAASKMERFSPRHLATTLWACASLRHADARMLSALWVQALACMSDMQPQALSNLAWALASLGVADEPLTAAVISRAVEVVDGLSMQGLANVGWAIVKLQQQLKCSPSAPPPASTSQHGFASSGSSGRLMSSACNPPQDSGRGWRAARSRVLSASAHELLDAICSRAAGELQTAKPQEVCNLLWACATLQHRHEAFLSAAATHLVGVAEESRPLDIAQALWALEVLRFRRKATHQALLLSALHRLHVFGPQALSNLAWAAASSGMQAPSGLAQAVAHQLQALLPQMTPQGLATTLWALSKLGRVPQQLVHTASSHITRQLPMFNAQDLCNVAMVCAKAGYKEAQLLQPLAAAASAAAAATLQAAPGTTQHIPYGRSLGTDSSSTQDWGAAQSQGAAQATPGLSDWGPYAAAGGSTRSKQVTAQGACNLVWAFAGTGWCDSALLQQLQQVALPNLTRLQPRNIAGLYQGFALLREPFDGLLAALPAACKASKSHGLHPKRSSPQGSLLHHPQQEQQQLPSVQPGLIHEGSGPGLWLQVQDMMQVLKAWPADSLALLVHSIAVAGAQDSQAALVLAAVKLLNRTSVADSLSPHRHSQLHLALVHLALHWGVASEGHTAAGHTAATAMAAAAAAGARKSAGPTTGWAAGEQSLVQQLVHASFAAELGAACCGPIEACLPCQQEQQELSGDQALLQSAVPGPVAGQAASDQAADLPQTAAVTASELLLTAAELLTGALAHSCLSSWQQNELAYQLCRVEQEVVCVLQGITGQQPLVQHWLQLTYTRPGRSHTPAALSKVSSRALAVKIGLPSSVLGPGRRPMAVCVLPPAALSSSFPRKVLGHTALEHGCLDAAGWQVVCVTWEEWDQLGGDLRRQQGLLQGLCDL